MNKDRLTKERRSWNMSRIRGKDTKPEKIVRSLLHRMGYRFRLHRRIPIQVRNAERGVRNPDSLSASTGERVGVRCRKRSTLNPQPPRPRFVTPDIVLVKQRVAIFVHGCFWHRHQKCKNCTTPTNRREWWLNKLNGNPARDQLHQAARSGRAQAPRLAGDGDLEIEVAKQEKLSKLLFRSTRRVPQR